MAKRNSTLKARSGRSRRRKDSESDLEPLRNPLEEVIEEERSRLSRARALLKCLHVALLYSDCEGDECDQGDFADTVSVAEGLVAEANEQLDSVNIGPLMDGKAAARGSSDRLRGVP